MSRSRPFRISPTLLRALGYGAAAIVVLAGVVFVTIQTGWGKNQIRQLIVREANQYLTATLEIGELSGSLFHDLTLTNVRLIRDGQAIVSAETIALQFSVRELISPGTTLRAIQVTRPRVVVARLSDGEWNLAALIKPRQKPGSGSGRPLHFLAVNIVDGDAAFRDPITTGEVHVPMHYAQLNASFSFDFEPGAWRLKFANAAWAGDEANLAVNKLTGAIANLSGDWQFDTVAIQTPQSALTFTGRINRGKAPTTLDLKVRATRFVFQEWARVVEALGHINIDSAFDLALKGPPTALVTDLTLRSINGPGDGDGGNIQGQFVLDTSANGWRGTGTASVARVNLARWLDDEQRPSDITGTLTFDLDLMPPDHHFPRGDFTFDGSHAGYLGYEIEDVRARGTITTADTHLYDLTGTAYGAALHITAGTIGIDAPNSFDLAGTAAGIDLRKLPPSVGISHVESLLALDTFEVTGLLDPPGPAEQRPFLTGKATFGDSVYLGVEIKAGATGAIDHTTWPPVFVYSGDGDISHVNIHHIGEGLDMAWMLDPRWAGVLAGRFSVDGRSGDSDTMTINGAGRLARADLFGGRLLDADVELHIADGSLNGSYDGRIEEIDAARAFADPRFDATLTGTATAQFGVHELMLRPATIADYDVNGTLVAKTSVVEGIPIDTGSLNATLASATLSVSSLQISGPKIEAQGKGSLELDGERSSEFDYTVTRADASLANSAAGRHLGGTIATTGHMSGPTTGMRLVGNADVTDAKDLDVANSNIASAMMQYDVTVPTDDPSRTAAQVTVHATDINVLDRQVAEANGTLTYNASHLDADVTLGEGDRLTGSVVLHPGDNAVDLSALTLTVAQSSWRLAEASTPPTIRWSDSGVDTMPLVFERATESADRVTVAGNWRADGSGALRVAGNHVALDTLFGADGTLGASEGAARYGGTADFDATISGTRDQPTAKGEIAVTDGRVRKLTYQRLGGHVEYAAGLATVNLRLDQTADTWLTAVGTVPISIAGTSHAAEPMALIVASSAVSLGLLEGVTDVVRDVSGAMTLNVKVTGTSDEPHFDGSMQFTNAGFVVTSTGARYKNGRASFELATDRLNVASFHLEDRNGQSLSVTGSIGTHALTVGDLKIDITAKKFEVLHDDTGSVNVNATLALRGEVNAPRIAGDVTVLSGELKIDEIFSQALYQPYSTQETQSATAAPPAIGPTGVSTSLTRVSQTTATNTIRTIDPIAALNPWDRLALAITLHSRGTLRFTGDNVQVAQGTPLGLGSFNLRATGDLYLSKDSGQPLDVSGSFDSITGSFAFQGRRFDLDPSSSVNFHGDLDPEIYVTVNRLISGVEARVTISGTVHAPELRLASTPPLDASDILSLIVFNASANELSAPQQQELAVRAGTLAYGFVATPLIGALRQSIGLDTLEIAPPDAGSTGPRVTVGNEFVPGLVAQFTRQFGEDAYDEATVEYYLSRIFRIRATFSDAGSLVNRSPFQRIERAGIDLLMFFSF